jgi:predicted metal-binding membrane protein
LVVLAWVYLLSGAGMDRMGAMPGMDDDLSNDFLVVTAMWSAMMVAMMTPSAAPTILLYGRVHRNSAGVSAPPTAAFLAGYLACWIAFALVAAALQFAFERTALASPATMALHGRPAAALLLVAAGLYQLSPLKDACLGRCRSPAEFLARNYRPGASGALRLGLLHGAYCVGCCWLLMALLFVGGVMNLIWIAALTLLVAAEKLLPGGYWLARIAGIAMVGWGAVLLLG